LHRELQFKIKGISMSSFTQEDVIALGRGGNARFNAVYMARHNPDRDNMQIPTSSTDMSRLRDFVNQKYTNQKWYSEDGASNVPPPPEGRDSFGVSNSSSDRRSSGSGFTPDPPRQVAAPDPPKRNELLDLFDSPNPTPAQQQPPQQSFDPFGSQQAPQSNGFSIQGQQSAANAFAGFDSQPAQNGGFDPFGSSQQQQQQAPPMQMQSAPNANVFGGPQMQQQQQFGQQPFGQPMQPMQPMPFLATKPPEPAAVNPAPVAAAEPPKPNLLSIDDAFDDLVLKDTAPPPSSNPFDATSSASAPTPAGAVNNPQSGPVPNVYGAPGQPNPMGMPPHGQQMGMPPQGQQMGAPPQGQQMGYNPQQGQFNPYQQQQPPPHMGYGHPPPQMGYGQPAPSQYGQPSGYPQQSQYPGQPVHQQYPGQYPPHAQQSTSSSMPQQQPPAPAPAPDPFSAMGGTAWGSVGGKPPAPVIPSYGDNVSGPTQPPAVDNNPFGGQQPPVVADANNPFASTTAAPTSAAPAEAPMNPFDMF